VVIVPAMSPPASAATASESSTTTVFEDDTDAAREEVLDNARGFHLAAMTMRDNRQKLKIPICKHEHRRAQHGSMQQ